MTLDDEARAVLGPRVREIGLREVGRRSGVAGSNLSAWLAGRVALPLARLDAIASACDITLTLKAARLNKARRSPPPS